LFLFGDFLPYLQAGLFSISHYRAADQR